MKTNTLIYLSIAFLISLSLLTTHPMDPLKLEIKELKDGTHSYSLVTPEGSSAAILTTIQGSQLDIFSSSAFDNIDISQMPPEISHLITGVKAIKSKHDLNKIIMIGDVYVPLAHRGKGYAHNLLEKTCANLFNQNTQTIILIPDPFEYKDNKQIVVNDEDKKQKLVKLYESCGFKKDNENKVIYMYRTIKN